MRVVFIGGAPKCGTSAVFDRLEREALVVASKPKETYYFLEPEHPLKKLVDQKGTFDSYFNPSDSGKGSIFLEATTHTLYSNHAFEQIKKWPEAQVIFILRNPIDRLVSSFLYTKHNLGAVKESFHIDDYVKALLEKNLDVIDKSILTPASKFVLMRDLEYGNYKKYLPKWSSQFGQDLLCLDYEELKTAPQVFYQAIYDFLGLPYTEQLGNAKKNQTISVKNAGLHRLLLSLNQKVRMPKPQWLKSLYIAIQKKDSSETLSDERKEQLMAYYAESNEYVKNHFNIDLDAK